MVKDCDTEVGACWGGGMLCPIRLHHRDGAALQHCKNLAVNPKSKGVVATDDAVEHARRWVGWI